MAGEPVLTYFEGRGRGEIVRIAFCLAKIQFKDNYVNTKAEWQKYVKDGKLLFGQMPIVEMDGMVLTQTNSIVRYLGGKGNLVPKDPKDQFRSDMLYEGARDFYAAYYPIGLGFFGTDDEVKEKMKKNMDKYLPIFNKELEKNGTGYLVGSSTSLADVSFLEVVLATVDYFGEDAFKDFPSVKKFLTTMKSLPEVKHYLSKVRHRKNDERYKNEIASILMS